MSNNKAIEVVDLSNIIAMSQVKKFIAGSIKNSALLMKYLPARELQRLNEWAADTEDTYLFLEFDIHIGSGINSYNLTLEVSHYYPTPKIDEATGDKYCVYDTTNIKVNWPCCGAHDVMFANEVFAIWHAIAHELGHALNVCKHPCKLRVMTREEVEQAKINELKRNTENWVMSHFKIASGLRVNKSVSSVDVSSFELCDHEFTYTPKNLSKAYHCEVRKTSVGDWYYKITRTV